MANVIFVKPVSREEKNCLANGCPPRVFWTGPYSAWRHVGGAVRLAGDVGKWHPVNQLFIIPPIR